MVVILAKRLSSVGRKKEKIKISFYITDKYYKKFKPILILFFPFSLSPVTIYKSLRERRVHPPLSPTYLPPTGRLAGRAFWAFLVSFIN